jgi:hypothetical protein
MTTADEQLALCPACGADLRRSGERDAPCAGASDHATALATWPWTRRRIAATRRVAPPVTAGAWRFPFLARWVRESPFHLGLIWLGVCVFHARLHHGPTTTTWILAAAGAGSVAALAWLRASISEYAAENGAIAWVFLGRALFADGPSCALVEQTFERLDAPPALLDSLRSLPPSDVHRAFRRRSPPHRLGTNALEASLVFAVLSALAAGRVRLHVQAPTHWRRRFGVRVRVRVADTRARGRGIAVWIEPSVEPRAASSDPLAEALLVGLWAAEAATDGNAQGYRQAATSGQARGAAVRVRVADLVRASVPVDLPAGRWAAAIASSAPRSHLDPADLSSRINALTAHHKTAAVMWLVLDEVREGVSGLRARAREHGFGRPRQRRRPSCPP